MKQGMGDKLGLVVKLLTACLGCAALIFYYCWQLGLGVLVGLGFQIATSSVIFQVTTLGELVAKNGTDLTL